VELELVLLEELLKSGCELAAEDAAKCTDGQEESIGRSDPSGAIGSKAASGNDVMYVGMMLKVRAPGMEHAEKPDLCSQTQLSRNGRLQPSNRSAEHFLAINGVRTLDPGSKTPTLSISSRPGSPR
jgi:hypothetical protein